MAETVGNHSVAAFSNPQNGDSLDATVVTGNDNTLRAGYVAHDADGGIHLQSSLVASRPAAGTAGRKWLTTDSGGVRLYYDNGTSWVEATYVVAGTNTTLTNLDVDGTLNVDGATTINDTFDVVGNATVDGDLDVSGTITGGAITVPASSVQPGTYPSGNYVVQGTITANAVLAVSGQMRAARATQTGSGGTVSFASANHIRHTMTGNGTLTLSGGSGGGVYTVEVLQDATGGRTVAWAAASGSVVWPGGVAPASTTTANRKDVFTFYFDGTNYLGQQFGANYASTA